VTFSVTPPPFTPSRGRGPPHDIRHLELKTIFTTRRFLAPIDSSMQGQIEEAR
jgi:hypothetical protein